MDIRPQGDERSTKASLIIDRVFSVIFLVAQPFAAVAQYLLVALGASNWHNGSQPTPHWAASSAYVLILSVPLAAAIATIVMLSKHRIGFWVPLIAMVLTSMMVAVL
ncbi:MULTISPECIES: hypothetical protein [unclassified Arthrobacter]|uniref:hypothetical protein n=1 Tax=unclassified Arthrobacter TaxID=235627 RepID=UPI002DFD2828|nr:MULTISPECIES: hypothetical protein [unclassified Arthrobacter]MEC5193447.1 hypothetical protein [Arthrobacter sp. MP_M4]MEC5204923.1 hypothetical protein [Arthrobacter sp. MP_M7]